MSTDAGSAAAPEDTATREVASERPGLESADPGSADSATSTPETADRGVEGSAGPDDDARSDRPGSDTGPDGASDSDGSRGADSGAAASDGSGSDGAASDGAGSDGAGSDGSGSSEAGATPAEEGFVASILRDATITGLPGDTGAPPAEPHTPEAQQQGDEPVGSEPRVGDNPRGVD